MSSSANNFSSLNKNSFGGMEETSIFVSPADMSEQERQVSPVHISGTADIESDGSLATPVGNNSIMNSEYPPQHQSSTITPSSEAMSDNSDVQCMIGVQIAAFIIIGGPFMFCDLYFAYTDDSCVHKPIPGMDLNLFIYLTVCGYVSVGAFIIMLMGNMFVYYNYKKSVMHNSFEFALVPLSILKFLMEIFTIAWTISGAILFWGTLNPTECNKVMYEYVYAQLIIKLVCIAHSLNTKNTKNNNK